MRELIKFRLVRLDNHRIIDYGDLKKLKKYIEKNNVTNYKIFRIKTQMFEVNNKVLENIK